MISFNGLYKQVYGLLSSNLFYIYYSSSLSSSLLTVLFELGWKGLFRKVTLQTDSLHKRILSLKISKHWNTKNRVLCFCIQKFLKYWIQTLFQKFFCKVPIQSYNPNMYFKKLKSISTKLFLTLKFESFRIGSEPHL